MILSIFIFFILIIILILLLYIILKTKTTFVSKDYINNIIDNSQYFIRMNPINLKIRNSISIEDYIKKYKDNIQDFSNKEKNLLIQLCKSVNKYIRFYKKINNIPWKFTKQNTIIENGFHHTLGSCIILSNDFFKLSQKQQVIILLHEKIHVYQRYYPIETELLLKELNFKIVNKFENIPFARNNPDINNFVYSYNNIELVQLLNESSVNLNDSYIENSLEKLNLPLIIKQYEHPFEIMGTLIPEIIINNYNDDSIFLKKLKQLLINNF